VHVRALLKKIASGPASTVLLTGESGTGKDLAAKVIHFGSDRAARPFMNITCSALPENLLESELFGHERGAFTGADRLKRGLFETADGGTVFLDEIGEMVPALQAKLLRFLEERTFKRVGGSADIHVDVRVIAATNRDLQGLVDEDKFREDLWYRMNTVRIVMPPLCERRDDIPLLATFFLNKYNGRYNRQVKLMKSGESALQEYTWPGNVRQLQHIIERLTILADRIDADTVHNALTTMESRDKPVETLADAEEDQIRKVLAATGGNKSKAAQILGIERKTLYRKLERMKV
jgi:transcriptional regulator with PAS, ATPase and Fis domain